MERRAESALLDGPAFEGGTADVAEPPVDFGPLAEVAGFMLRLAQLQVFEAFFADFAGRDIRPGQIGILIAIGENPGIRQGALARALRIKRSNMAKIVRLLVSEGLIRRSVPSNDRRSVELSLTPAARTFVARALPDIHASDQRATANLTGSERAALMRLLRKMTGAQPAEAEA